MQKLLKAERIFRRTIKEHRLFSPGAGILLAVSGGADSMALLHLFAGLREEQKLRLWALTLDHRLRPESRKEVELVKETCLKLQVPCYGLEIPVEETARQEKISREEAGSKLRKQCLQAYRENLGAEVIATGHHLDDQAETILLHLIRGCGEQGLRGIYPLTPQGVIRPLLDLSREDLREYCREREVPFMEDASNRDFKIPRNRIRGELLPLLAQYNPQIKLSLSRLGENLRECGEALDETAEALYRECLEEETAEQVAFELKKLRALSPFWQRSLMRLGIEHLQGDLKDLSRVNFQALEELLSRSSGRGCPLPGKLWAEKNQTGFLLLKNLPSETPLSPQVLSWPGAYRLEEWGLEIAGEILPAGNYTPESAWEGYFDAALLSGETRLRSREPGDRYLPPGKKQDKKIKELFQELKIPGGKAGRREKIPLLEKAGKIVWIIGLDWNREFLAGKDSRQVCRLKAQEL